jgi:CheY-like chemotaxis protein
MVYGSVKGHDGWVEVWSEPGRGSRFTLFFPEWDPAEAAARVALESPAAVLERLAGVAPEKVPGIQGATAVPAGPPSTGPSRTILAVDDESTVLALARDILEMNGYRVLTARNGEEALRVYGENRRSINLVLLDLTMPVMGGRECLKRILGLDPGARVVISSGYSVESTVGEVLQEGALDFVSKPYDIDVLARVIRQALERPAAPVVPQLN